MDQTSLSIDSMREHVDESMKMARHFEEYIKLFTKMIAREMVKEKEKKQTVGNLNNSVLSKEKFAFSVSEVSKLLGLNCGTTY